MIYKNPEFKKNIKLEFSATRLLIPAFVLALTAWIGWSMGTQPDWEKNPVTYAKAQSLTFWMFGFGFIFSIIWGSYLASNSLFGEMKQKTWDFIRMSSIPPQKILFGKLFGSTSVVWAISLLGIIPIMLFASPYLFIGGGYHRPVFLTLTSLITAIIFWMILSYAVVMLAGAYTYSRDTRHTTIGAVLGVLIIGLFIGVGISTNYVNEFTINEACRYFKDPVEEAKCLENNPLVIDGVHYALRNNSTINWYGFEIFPLDAVALLLVFSACWSVAGLYRALRSSLQYMDYPYIWPIFLMTSAFFLNGFYFYDRYPHDYMMMAALLFALTIFPVCIKEAKNKIAYRQLYESIQAKQYRETFRLTPLWAISLFCFVLIAPLVFVCASPFAPVHYKGLDDAKSFELAPAFSFFYLSLILFAVRDILAIHVISWRKSIRLPTIGIIVYLLLIYILAPFLAHILFGSDSNGRYYFMPLKPIQDYVDVPSNPDPMAFVFIHTATILALFIPFRKGLKNILGKK